MLELTKCDALMIGRGSVINPFIFHQIQAHFNGEPYIYHWSSLERYFEVYLSEMPSQIPEKTKVNKLKQMMSFLFKGNDTLLELRPQILRLTHTDVNGFLHEALPLLKQNFSF
jgi:tRNA-dihydrouridine synthase C